MDGPEVFRRAVRVMVDSANRAMERAGVRVEDLSLFVPHQANIRIIEAATRRLGIPDELVGTNLASVGNTSAASIPLVLAEAADAERVRPGDLVLVVGFGAGMSWASAVIEWAR
jgi:3-oxoacyl-[acyl-carrier-protein] synthase-3